MPGIVGILEKKPWIDEPTDLIQRMAEPLKFDPKQRIQTFAQDRCAAAVVDYGNHLSFLKSASASRDRILLIMDGEVFPNVAEVPHELVGSSPTIQRADYCLHLYLQHGPDFVNQLNGSFAIAVHDGRDGKTHLYTDRFNSYVLCYWQENGIAAFASSARCLLNYRRDIGTSYDPLAVAELFVFEHVVGERTLFPDIRRMLPGSRATWDARRWTTAPYREITPKIDPQGMRSWEDAACELDVRLTRAMRKRTADGAQIGMLVSGGADSRLVLAKCPPSTIAMTFSNKDAPLSKETLLALRITKILGLRHELLDRDLDYYANLADQAANVNDGLVNFIGCHSIGQHPKMTGLGIEVVMTAQWFDTFFKGWYAQQILSQGIYDVGPRMIQARRAARIFADTSVIRKGDRQDLMMLAFKPHIRELAAVAKENVICDLAKWFESEAPFPYLSDTFGFRNMQTAGAAVGFSWGVRSGFLDRTPTFDNDLFDLGWSMPPEWKLRGRVVRRAVHLASPPLGRIRDANTGLPVSLCPPWDVVLAKARNSARQIAKRLASHAKWINRYRQPPEGCRVFQQHNSWHDMNGALKLVPIYRRLVEDAIDQLDSDIFDVDTIRTLLKKDLEAPAPILNNLFELVVTFGLFHKRWGPQTRSKASSEPAAVS